MLCSPKEMKVRVTSWDRKLWAVVHSSPTHDDAMILGDAWHALREPFYPGEASRCLLFKTKHEAQAWCRREKAKYADRRDFVAKWRFKPIRVRCTIKPAGFTKQREGVK